jgi:putative aldouronate transport system substrate-binding protein
MLIVGLLLLVAAGLFAGGRGDSSTATGSDATLEFTALATQYQLPPRPTDPFWTDMEKRFNVKYRINWVQDSSWSETLGRLVATDALPEVVQINNQADAGFVQAVEAGMFWDLTPYLDWNQYPNLGKISTNAWMNSKYQGKNYIIPSSRGQYDSGWFIRTDVLTKYNLPRPTTLAQFNAYMDACLKEGIIPIPYWIQKEITRFQDCFGDGNMIPVYTADNTGIVPNILTESYALAVDYFRDCYTKGYLAREFANVDPSQTENFLVTGKGGIYFKNSWHRYRLNDELHKVVPTGETEPIFFLEGPGGISVWYDQGFYGGMAISKKVPESKMKRIIGFYNETANPDMVNYFQYGIPGIHHNVVDGFPQFTEQGRREINNTTYIPFMLATTTWIKVDSPLAPPEYNLESREMISVIDDVAEKIGKAPFQTFSIISSRSYARFWAQYQNDFYAAVVDTITGVKTPAQFRAYQQQLLRLPDVQAAERELKQSWDSYGLVNWKPSN